jgi:hypothetical protein
MNEKVAELMERDLAVVRAVLTGQTVSQTPNR